MRSGRQSGGTDRTPLIDGPVFTDAGDTGSTDTPLRLDADTRDEALPPPDSAVLPDTPAFDVPFDADAEPRTCVGDYYVGLAGPFPDPTGCREITGRLTIVQSGWRDLDALRDLERIGGHFVIQESSVESLSGIERLREVGGTVGILNNESLRTVDAFGSLTTVGGDFSVADNDSLESMGALTSLISVRGAFSIVHHPRLHSFGGAPRLTQTGRGIADAGLVLSDNPQLTGDQEFPVLTDVGGSLDVGANGRLGALRFPLLERVAVAVRFTLLEQLTVLELPSLASVAGDFVVEGCIRLSECAVDAVLAHTSVGGSIWVTDTATCF